VGYPGTTGRVAHLALLPDRHGVPRSSLVLARAGPLLGEILLALTAANGVFRNLLGGFDPSFPYCPAAHSNQEKQTGLTGY